MSKRGLTPHIRGRGRETVFFIPGNVAAKLREFRLRQHPLLPAGETGGASRDRTGDLKLAKLALSQLSYGPISRMFANVRTDEREPQLLVGREGVEPSTSRLSGVRSNHLSYRPPRAPIKAVL